MRPAAHAAILLLLGVAAGLAQAPDNTDIQLEPDDELSGVYGETVRDVEAARAAEAETTGETTLPVLAEPLAEPETPEAAAAAPAAAGGYEAAAAGTAFNEPAEPADADYRTYGTPGLAPGQDLSDLLAALIEEWSRAPAIVALDYGGGTAADAAPAASGGTPAAPPTPAAAVKPGTALYARLLYEVNSDFPGPVLAELLEPPFTGAIVTGAFEVVRDRMVLRFQRLDSGGASTPVDAFGVGLDCACYGVEGEVDRHWFDRVILPAALSFAEGWTAALARPETSVTVQGDLVVEETRRSDSGDRLYEGISAATGQIGRVLTEDAPRAITVRIPRNTELLVTFTGPGALPPALALTETVP